MDADPDSPASSSATPEFVPERPVQPAFFYPSGHNVVRIEDEDCEFLSPDQDPLATRGIPVFKPTMEEFEDFERYMERVEVWGRKSGIVKVIPPEEWSDSLPPISPSQLRSLKLRNPIEQHMLGHGGLFRQSNVEKRRVFNLRDWAELCGKDDLRAPLLKDGAVNTRRAPRAPLKSRRKAKTKGNTANVGDVDPQGSTPINCTHATSDNQSATPNGQGEAHAVKEDEEPDFYSAFNPRASWLPEDTKAEDYTPEACRELERLFWRTCGLGAPALYGADMAGTLFTDETKAWNVGHLPSFLSRLCARRALPGVNSPYLYFGMWRATFAWHVEDMDLYSINYIHWGAPKYWYAIPSGRSHAFERVMQGYFPGDINTCPQFLRHKSYLASPSLLANASCRPNMLVQHQGEFVITYPRGYHAGFNLGLNCAESVNFALENWIELGRKAAVCNCVADSVRIDVDALLMEAEADDQEEHFEAEEPLRKRKLEAEDGPSEKKPKRMKKSPSVMPTFASPDATLTPPTAIPSSKPRIRIPPAPQTPCCLCASPAEAGLLPVHDSPLPFSGVKPTISKDEHGNEMEIWRAHEQCVRAIPETWVDVVRGRKMAFGVDAIVKDRWQLKCTACTRPILKAHGAKVQCTKGKCPKSFHVSCAISSEEVSFRELDEVEKEVVLIDPLSSESTAEAHHHNNTLVPMPAVNDDGPPVNVYKTIKKPNIELLCPQHNPVIIEQKKVARLQQVRNDVLALSPLSRIRLRVSTGVYEVTLVRVDEERASVVVEWTPGENKEFKWGSIMWGQVPEGTIVRKAEVEMGPPKASRAALPPAAPPITPKPALMDRSVAGPSRLQKHTAPPAPGNPTITAPSTSSAPAMPLYQPPAYPSTYQYSYPAPVQGYHWSYPYPAPGSSSLPTAAPLHPGYHPTVPYYRPSVHQGYYYYPQYSYPGVPTPHMSAPSSSDTAPPATEGTSSAVSAPRAQATTPVTPVVFPPHSLNYYGHPPLQPSSRTVAPQHPYPLSVPTPPVHPPPTSNPQQSPIAGTAPR